MSHAFPLMHTTRTILVSTVCLPFFDTKLARRNLGDNYGGTRQKSLRIWGPCQHYL